jgi:hypothetical protein
MGTAGQQTTALAMPHCHYQSLLNADPWPNHLPAPTFERRMV